jgi:hypothetical protein
VGHNSLQPFRQRFAGVQDSDFYSRWAKWFLWTRLNDPAPEFMPDADAGSATRNKPSAAELHPKVENTGITKQEGR